MQELQPLAALLARQAADLEVYAGFLYAALDGSRPAELVQVQRRQAVADRLRGRPGAVVGVSVLLGDQRFTLERKDIVSSSRAAIAHEVGGIVLSRRELGLAEWSQALVAALARIAQDNAAAADVLRRLTSFAV